MAMELKMNVLRFGGFSRHPIRIFMRLSVVKLQTFYCNYLAGGVIWSLRRGFQRFYDVHNLHVSYFFLGAISFFFSVFLSATLRLSVFFFVTQMQSCVTYPAFLGCRLALLIRSVATEQQQQ